MTPQPSTTLTISNARALGLEGTHTAEVRHCNAAGGCSSYSLNITFTLPRFLRVDDQNPFTGQTATLTASPPSSLGAITSYQWQKWSNGAWTNIASATSTSYPATSSTSGVRTFRVRVTSSSGTTVDSPPASIQWKSMTVTVSFSPEYPESGTATKRTVTLTATADAPSGVEYQWQEGNGSSWTNLGAKSTSAARDVSHTTSSTRKYRVQVSHSVVPSVDSEPVYVTWDEFATVRDMLNKLHASTTSDTNYIRDQTDLVSCMNDNRASTSTPTYASFSDILSRYAGDTKTTIEDHCSATSTRMFNTNKTVSRSELAALKTSSTLYSTLLETPHGREFEENLADPDFLKQVSYMGAHVADPGSLQRPVYNPSSGASGQSDNPPPSVTLDQGPGLACLPARIDKDRLTLDNKLRVINCLVFATPHDFWVKGDGTRVADLLKSMIDSSNGRYNWLNRGDWECTYSPDAALPSCLKHDVAYGGLQKIAGTDTTVANGTELDEAWNPRNKALADYKFRADIRKYGCQDSTTAGYILCGIFSNGWMAENIYFEAVARKNDKGWPVTERDVVDFTTTRGGFINCAEPVVPEVRNVNFTRSGSRFTVTGEYVSGCVPVDLSDVDIELEWDFVWYDSAKYPGTTCTNSGDNFSCYDDLSFMPPGTVVTGVSVSVAPKDRTYGGYDYGGEGDTGRRTTLILRELIN